MDKNSDAYKDKRNAQYREKHKFDTLSKHGKVMREYFASTTREQRAEERARKQAWSDIKDYIAKTRHITDPVELYNTLLYFFETE